MAELTVRETLDFSRRVQGAGNRAGESSSHLFTLDTMYAAGSPAISSEVLMQPLHIHDPVQDFVRIRVAKHDAVLGSELNIRLRCMNLNAAIGLVDWYKAGDQCKSR